MGVKIMADLSLDGLASGMPTKDTINQILNAEYGTKLKNLSEEQNTLETEKNAWRDVNSRIDKLEQKLTQLKFSSTFTSNKTDSSDEGVVTASATTGATEGSYDIEVTQKALAQRVAGTDQSASIENASATEDISSIAMQNGGEYTVTNFSLDQTIDGTTYSHGLKNSSGNIVAVSNDQQNYTSLDQSTAEGDLSSLTADNLGQNYDFGSTISTDTVTRMNGTGAGEQNTLKTAVMMKDDTVTINGNDISVSATDTLKDFVTKINDSGAGVNASIVSNRLVLESKDTGTDNEMTLGDTNGSLTDLGVLTSGTIDTSNEGYQQAQNAKVNVNGITGITSQDNTIDEAVSDVTFQISDEVQPTETATVTVSKDTENASSKVQEFVDQYNSLQDFMNKKLDYDAETEKAGTLQGDSTLMRLQSKMRGLVMDQVDSGNQYNSLNSVGINSNKDGTLEFDSSKFATALQDDPEKVKNLFTSEEADDGFDGVATKTDNYLDSVIKTNTGVIPSKIDSYERMTKDIDQTIDSTNDSLEQEKERLTNEFTAMEKALSEMNNQMSWMQSQLGSMGGSSTLSSMM
jgi:flagellar hook-associated protein 2